MKLLRTLIEERRASKQIQQDMLGYLMNEEANRFNLTDDEMIDLIITILYSGYETVSTTSMMAVKYLHDHPKVLEQLRVSTKLNNNYIDVSIFLNLIFVILQKEHMAIREKKKPEDPIDYNDYKAMRFTRAVSSKILITLLVYITNINHEQFFACAGDFRDLQVSNNCKWSS